MKPVLKAAVCLLLLSTRLPAQTAVTPLARDLNNVCSTESIKKPTVNISRDSITPPILLDGESFEGAEFPPPGWSVINVDGAGKSWDVFATGTAHSGGKVAKHSFGVAGYAEEGFLVTPQITFPQNSTPILYFWEQCVWPSDYYYHGVWVSETDTQPASFIELSALPGAMTAPAWGERYLDLSAYKGKSIYLAFKYCGTFADSWHLDDVKVYAGHDDEPPVITEPSSILAIAGNSIQINTTVTDLTGIASVVCQYRLNGQTNWTDIQMTASKISGNYSCIIPAQLECISGLVRFIATDTVTPIANTAISAEAAIQWVVFGSYYDFETGIPSDWTLLDADCDGRNWTVDVPATFAVHSGIKALHSASYIEPPGAGVITPDNFVILHKSSVSLTCANLQFWVCAQDASNAGEHYGVGISNTGTAASDFTMLFEETLTAKNHGAWYERTIVIPNSYAGQNVYLALRHFNCTNNSWLSIDDVSTSGLSMSGLAESSRPAAVSLSQNYPNPFNPTTAINFYNNMTGNVKLTVLNAKGETVTTLINNNVAVGSHKVDFDGAAFNSGVYFYKLETPTATITKKMLLVK